MEKENNTNTELNTTDKITPILIEEEMNTSFLDYAMSVIVSRAIPDVRDGLKPVHRRILYAMNDLGNYANKPYKKSARIVGDVIGKYHPHGDSSVYEAMVRMAQDFASREMLVDGHGNFGSIDGDGAAAMRYTEARMSKLAMEMLKDIDKQTIDYQDNYDATEREPIVLPGRVPNLLVNGTTGIAVGMSTNIPPHNLNEVINTILQYIDNKDITIDDMLKTLPGPDFPLGGEILGTEGIIDAYKTGRGKVKVRSKYEIFEEKNGKNTLIFTEIPFQVNKAVLVEKIADCIRDKRVEGVTDLRDESDRDGIRIVLELKRGMTPEVVINQLFKFTRLEDSFSIQMLALANGEPKTLNLKEVINHYYLHQIEVLERKTIFEKERAESRIHILNGLKIAVDHIDNVITIIKSSNSTADAKTNLSSKYPELTSIQLDEILNMKLSKLTGLEIEKLIENIKALKLEIERLDYILNNTTAKDEIVKGYLIEMQEKYSSPRRTTINTDYFDSSIDYEDLIEEEETLVSITRNGYIKRMKPTLFRTQNRGGKGVKSVTTKDEDSVLEMLKTSTHSDLLFFTDTGKVYRTRTHRAPDSQRTAKGLPLINLIDIDKEDTVTDVLALKEIDYEKDLIFVTKKGLIKKTNAEEYLNVNRNGKIAIRLNDDDEVVSVFTGTDEQDVLVSSNKGKISRYSLEEVSRVSRASKGSKAITLEKEGFVINAGVATEDDKVFVISENGYGKLSNVIDFRKTKRGSKGVTSQKITDKTGNIASSLIVTELSDSVTLLDKNGQTINISIDQIPTLGRNTQGVTLMRGDIEITTALILNKQDGTVEQLEPSNGQSVEIAHEEKLEVDKESQINQKIEYPDLEDDYDYEDDDDL